MTKRRNAVSKMILGVGTDLIEIKRMEKACSQGRFVSRVFTETESRQAKGAASKLAGSFAVKEAVAKVLGTGFRSFMPGGYRGFERQPWKALCEPLWRCTKTV